jgi:hypothetical protein
VAAAKPAYAIDIGAVLAAAADRILRDRASVRTVAALMHGE